MIRLISLVVFVVGLSTSLIAQIYIPPVFGKDSLDTRSDELSRLYIPPKRIMWVSHDSLVQNKEVLLLSGNGQPELGKRNMCSMYTCGRDTASILLDYGRELHGGLKLVLGARITTPRRTTSTRPAWRRRSRRSASTTKPHGSSSSRRFRLVTPSRFANGSTMTVSCSLRNSCVRATPCTTICIRAASWSARRRMMRRPCRRRTRSWTCSPTVPPRRRRTASTRMGRGASPSWWSVPLRRRRSSCSPIPISRCASPISTSWTRMRKAAVSTRTKSSRACAWIRVSATITFRESQ